jgi:SOS-response transcriptional repressor LexA
MSTHYTTVQAGQFSDVGTYTRKMLNSGSLQHAKLARSFWLEVNGHSMTAAPGTHSRGMLILVDLMKM